MFRIFHKRAWRGAIGLVVAYALVLQAFLAYAVVSQAAAQGNSFASNSLFVICISHDDTAADDTGAPVKPTTHCPTCTLSTVTAAALPDPVPLPNRLPAAERTSFVPTTAYVSVHTARAGLSRAPPQNV